MHKSTTALTLFIHTGSIVYFLSIKWLCQLIGILVDLNPVSTKKSINSGVVFGFPQQVSESNPWFWEEFQASKVFLKFHPNPNLSIICFEVIFLLNIFSS